VASKVAEAEQPGVCPPQWLSMILASTPGPPNHRGLQLNNVFAIKAALETAVQEYAADVDLAIDEYGPIADWDVSAITDMSNLFLNLVGFDANIANWDTASVTNMHGMFEVRFL
jgi:hypothetical protein